MPLKDPVKRKEYHRLRGIRRRAYFREYRRTHPQDNKYTSHGSSMGYQGEELALKVLVGSKRIYRPCDLSWKGKLVDIKTAKPTKQVRGGNRWKFLLSKQKNTANLFLLICKDLDDKVIDMYLIPNIGKDNISFNEKSRVKYKQYLLSL